MIQVTLSLSYVLIFQLEGLPLEFLVEQIQWQWTLCLEISYFLPQFLKNSFARYNILGWQIKMSWFKIYNRIDFCPAKFPLRNLIILWEISNMWWVTFLWLFKKTFQQFDYTGNVSWCVFLWAYHTWSLLSFLDSSIYFIKFDNFSVIISSNIRSAPFFSFWTPIMFILISLCSTRILDCSFSFTFFFFFWLFRVHWYFSSAY